MGGGSDGNGEYGDGGAGTEGPGGDEGDGGGGSSGDEGGGGASGAGLLGGGVGGSEGYVAHPALLKQKSTHVAHRNEPLGGDGMAFVESQHSAPHGPLCSWTACWQRESLAQRVKQLSCVKLSSSK
eukprot:5398079-Prymnesium_polylepis.1